MTPPASRSEREKLGVFVATPLGRGGQGGIDRIMDEVRRRLAAAPPADCEVAFLTTRGQGHIAWSPAFLAKAILTLGLARSRGRAHLLHVNLSSHGSTRRKLILCRAARAIGIPYVVHLHGSRFESFYRTAAPATQENIRIMFSRAARIIALGQMWKRFVAGVAPEAADRIEVIANATRSPARLAPRVGNPVTILFLGHVGARKGVPVLIQALARMRTASDWRVVIAGNGDVAEARLDVAAHGLEARVELTGWVGQVEVERLLDGADILVLPSFNENLPMSVIEGMAHGLAIVTTPVGAVEDIIVDGRNGLLVPPGNVAALAQALGTLVDDAPLRLRLGDAAAAFHAAHLEIGPYVDRLLAVWRACAAPRT